jgi:hypothetical protein
MKDGLKLKKGCSFDFGGQTYRGGTKRDTIPPEVLAKVEKLPENKRPNLEKLKKLKFVEEKKPAEETEPVKDDGGKSKRKS